MSELLRDIKEFRDVSVYTDLPEEYVDGLTGCIQSAFGGGVTVEDGFSHMQGDQILIGFDSNRDGKMEIVGFSSTSIQASENVEGGSTLLLTNRHAYFAAAAISKSRQGHGLYGALNDRRMDFVRENELESIVTRTQNPRVEQSITQALDRLVEARSIRSFKIARQLIKGVYGGMLTDSRPAASHVSYDNIDYERGDAHLINWQLFS